MKRSRRFSVLIFIIFALFIGALFFFWLHRAAVFWGLGTSVALIVAALGAGIAAAALAVKPIPVKTAAVAVIYMLISGLLAECVFGLLGLIISAFISVRDCWLVPPLFSLAEILYSAVHCKKTVLTRYSITSERVKTPVRIALISDVHMGLSVDEKRLTAAAESLSAEKPDLLIIAGDLVDDKTTPKQMQAACRIIGSVRTAHGVFFVYGNHDTAVVGPRLSFSPEVYRETLLKNNIKILDDKVFSIDGLVTLVGRLDAWGGLDNNRAELSELLKGADTSLPVIVADHQPGDIRKIAKNGVLLQLSGHTHGGQIWPAGTLYSLFNPGRTAFGHKSFNGTHLIVSSGLGTRGSRLRSGCTAETVIVDILPTDMN